MVWVKVKDLRAGDVVLEADGEHVVVEVRQPERHWPAPYTVFASRLWTVYSRCGDRGVLRTAREDDELEILPRTP